MISFLYYGNLIFHTARTQDGSIVDDDGKADYVQDWNGLNNAGSGFSVFWVSGSLCFGITGNQLPSHGQTTAEELWPVWEFQQFRVLGLGLWEAWHLFNL